MRLSSCQISYYSILNLYDDPVGNATVVLIYTQELKPAELSNLIIQPGNGRGGPPQSHVPGFKHSVVTECGLHKCMDPTGTHPYSCVTLSGLFLSRDLPYPINEDSIGLL